MHRLSGRALRAVFALLLLAAGTSFAQEQSGTPLVVGSAPGETTAAIMARQASVGTSVAGLRIAPRLRPTLVRQLNPGQLPALEQSPAGDAAGGRKVSPKAAFFTSGNFLGARLFDANAVPPDSMGAAGPEQFIVAVNGRIRSFDKTSATADGIVDVDTDIFFKPVMTPLGGGVTSNFTSDPRIRYDRGTKRWFIVMIDVPNNGSSYFANRVMIAVSDTPIVSAGTVWTYFFFNPTANFVDYPTLGVDNNALYIGANIFNLAGTAYVNADAYVVRKSSILGAGPGTVTVFSNLITGLGCTPGQDGPYTPQGVDNASAAATEGYFIGVSWCFFSELVVRRVINPGSASPTISANIAVNTPLFTVVYTQPHLGNTLGVNGYLDASDTRLMSAQVRGGNLYTAHGITVDASGTAVSSVVFDPNGRNAARWYRINSLTTTPAVAESGTVFDNAAVASARWYSYPGIQVTGQGHMAIGVTASGTLLRANGAYTGRLATDPAGATDTPTLYTNTLAAYDPAFDPGGAFGRRWGDYSYTSVDPNDDMSMYTIQEYTEADDSWGVRVVRLNAPAPAQPTSSSVSSIPQGTPSTTFTLTGTSSGGTGFFDPGPGFANRLAVEVLPGVTVTGVTVTDSTHLQVTVNTQGASVGDKTIRVINPDGQVATQASVLLTVTGTAPPLFTSPNSLICSVGVACNFTFTTQNGPTSPTTFTALGTLPAGVVFATPSLSGTPAVGTQGTYTLTVTANNGSAPNAVQTFTLIVTASCGGFTDVTTGDSFCNSAEWLKNRGVTLGCTATTYCPSQTVTRAQMALFMQRLGDTISPAVYSDNVLSTGALYLDNRPTVCNTAAFPPANYPRVAMVSWSFEGNADTTVDSRVYSRTSFDNGFNYVINEVALPRVRVVDREFSGTSATVKVNVPAGASPRFQLRLDRVNGTFFNGNFADARCNIAVVLMSVNGGASPFDPPVTTREFAEP